MNSANVLTLLPGTYALILSASSKRVLRVGRLGQLDVQRSFYVYIGSAFGLGGVRARVAHHWRPAPQLHWHIDYLRAVTELRDIGNVQRSGTRTGCAVFLSFRYWGEWFAL